MNKYLNKFEYEELIKDPVAFDEYIKLDNLPFGCFIEDIEADIDTAIEWAKQQRLKDKKKV
jgi:hypothetical protein